mgnify:CR=1 FL=1
MDYTHFMREMISVNDKAIAIEVLNSLIDIYSKELYILDQQKSRDWKKQYNYQLKIDRTNQVIEELKKLI